jgi:Fur family transcriptional regulator, ferric uptake regulator
MNREEQFKERLRLVGERVTNPRLGVFRILLRQAPVPMAKLIERSRAEGIDTVTVYRTVDLFRKLGVVQEVGLGRNRMLELGDDYGAHHHHVTCVECGRIMDFDSEVIEADLARVGKKLGFEIKWHQLEATGVGGGELA